MADVYIYIDGSREGLPDAPGYYRTFRREPSRLPTDDIAIDPSRMTVSTKPSVEALLDLIIKVGAQGEFMVVCHAWTNGIHMTILGGDSPFLTVDTIGSLDKVMDVEARAAAIRALPDGTAAEKQAKLDKWRDLIGGLDAALVQKPFTLAQAEALFQKGFDTWAVRPMSLQTLGGAAALRRLLDKIKKVRALKMKRLEFRACKLAGPDKTTMLAIKKFFACNRLLAPSKETFFLGRVQVLTIFRMAAIFQLPKGRDGLRRIPTTAPTRARGGQGRGRVPGPIGTGALTRAQAFEIIDRETTRAFMVSVHVWSYKTVTDAETGFTYQRPTVVRAMPEFFSLTVNETSRFHYQGFASVPPQAGRARRTQPRDRAEVRREVHHARRDRPGGRHPRRRLLARRPAHPLHPAQRARLPQADRRGVTHATAATE
jgi:hypothetical protein